jgi:hypothetical protein
MRALYPVLAPRGLSAAAGYTTQDTVSQALTHEQERLAAVISQRLDRSHREALDRLLENAPELYEITQLRRAPKDFSANEIKHIPTKY